MSTVAQIHPLSFYRQVANLTLGNKTEDVHIGITRKYFVFCTHLNLCSGTNIKQGHRFLCTVVMAYSNMDTNKSSLDIQNSGTIAKDLNSTAEQGNINF